MISNNCFLIFNLITRFTWLHYRYTYHNAGSRLASLQPSYGISSWEKSGKSTWIPPIEFNVQWIECVTTALTSCECVRVCICVCGHTKWCRWRCEQHAGSTHKRRENGKKGMKLIQYWVQIGGAGLRRYMRTCAICLHII